LEKLLLTPEEAAEVLSIGRTKVYELMAKRHLGSVRIGTSRRVPLDAVKGFIDSLVDQSAEVTAGALADDDTERPGLAHPNEDADGSRSSSRASRPRQHHQIRLLADADSQPLLFGATSSTPDPGR
jgi:excisionase family DNA binding protein